MLDRRRRSPGLIMQPARCVGCQTVVTLHVSKLDMTFATRSVPWTCPYCRRASTAEIIGQLAAGEGRAAEVPTAPEVWVRPR
jgi:hypothetical protein